LIKSFGVSMRIPFKSLGFDASEGRGPTLPGA
jgi:hypothetical protein